MAERKGQIKVNTDDIFPIIKKWLYSEHDIFLRELVANGTDAITKRASIARNSNEEIPDGRIDVVVNEKKGTIEVKDNGLGMTEAEIEKYIAQLAFSGAREFVDKLKAEGTETYDIIGKFGLGFYSVFMVADKVEVESLSMQKGATPAKWTCAGDTEYTFSESSRDEVGTTVRLFIKDESREFLNGWKLQETLKNFCDFMPYKIYITDESQEKPEPRLINDTEPLWRKDPQSLKDEDYKKFFTKLFPMEPTPLFWIHLKVDHPFTLDGILYFPKLNLRRPTNESNIRLYCKQVFVSNNVKDVIPDFLSLLKGVIDSQDIPLNVSRSALQGDPNIKRISNYVVKKVAEALKKLYKNDRKKYEDIWEDIGLFVKYGVISDSKFDEAMRKYVIFKNASGHYVTLEEYQNSIPENYKEKLKGKILYSTINKSDNVLRSSLCAEGIESLEMDENIDPHFIQHLEYQPDEKDRLKFVTVDSEYSNLFAATETTAEDAEVKELFENILSPKPKDDKAKEDPMATTIEIGNIKNASTVAYIKVDEAAKRMQAMMRTMGQNENFPIKKTLVINPNNLLIKNAVALNANPDNKDLVNRLCHYVEDLALLSSDSLNTDEKTKFVIESEKLLSELTSKIK